MENNRSILEHKSRQDTQGFLWVLLSYQTYEKSESEDKTELDRIKIEEVVKQ